ncbi:MAG TPA: di-heme oxidoredictase family protein, partial [Chitinophagales bacterium]|nr:di-heme oxidoredictase family protein [Chitinophagales bacterium]
MKRLTPIVLYIILVMTSYSCKKDTNITNVFSEEFPGGETTYPNIFSGVFEQPSPNLNATELAQHGKGDVNFSAIFVTSPAIKNYGLGPIFNHNSCVSCHVKDGRTPQPFSGDDLKGLLLRLSIPGTDPHGGPLDAPGFGGQLQNKGIVGTQAEAKVQLSFVETSYTFDDGTPYTLRKPIYTLVNSYLPLPGSLMVSPRIGPQIYGLGLLEAIKEN